VLAGRSCTVSALVSGSASVSTLPSESEHVMDAKSKVEPLISTIISPACGIRTSNSIASPLKVPFAVEPHISSPGWVGAGVVGEDVGLFVGLAVGESEEHSMTISNVPDLTEGSPLSVQAMSALADRSCTVSEAASVSVSVSLLPSESMHVMEKISKSEPAASTVRSPS